MSESDERFGRRSAPRDGKPQAEPVLSFAPQQRAKAPRLRDTPAFGPASTDSRPRIEDADRPAYLARDQDRGRSGRGWIALTAIAVIALAGAYAWHLYMPSARDAAAAPPPTAQSLGSAGLVTSPNPPAADAAASPSAPQAADTKPLPEKTTPPALATAAPHPPERAPAKPAMLKPAAPKPAAPRKEAALDLAPPQALPLQPALPPTAATAVPPLSGRPATGMPLPLTSAAAPAERDLSSLSQPSAAAPVLHRPPPAPQPPVDATPANPPNTVTVDGVTYVEGQQPRTLGTLSDAPPPATADATPAPTPASASVPAAMPSVPAYTGTPYTPPSDAGNQSAPLPNDVIILPNGQMTVPSGAQ
ncbi:MAG TPA: hypothetical protein VNF99_13995 [Stellaceae bacterium]|nr:hypothetical protein [Stellaceae bacterium]